MEKGSFLRLAGDLIGESLLEQRRLPEEGWDDLAVSLFLEELAAADSNNHLGNVGVGEREGRVFSRLVAQRNFGLAHGIGRSGDIAALQPKAAGSSLLFALTRRLALDALHVCGLRAAKAALVVPFATGMSLALCFSALRSSRPRSAHFIIFSRIDQKACLKSIYSAGFEAEVVEMRRATGSYALQTDLDGIADAIDRLGPENVLCVLSTTSTFAPREPDQVDEIARLCKAKDVGHVVNNAYGLQCTKCCHLVDQALRTGRVDAVVQSTDKNFLTPVGGAIIAGDPASLQRIAATYPGRAGSGPVLDLFITLLQMGRTGLTRLLRERRELHAWFAGELEKLCAEVGSRILEARNNRISFALDLSFLEDAGETNTSSSSGGHVGAPRHAESPDSAQMQPRDAADAKSARSLTFFGSALFKRRCSGLRVVPCWPPSPSPASPPPQSLSPSAASPPAPPVSTSASSLSPAAPPSSAPPAASSAGAEPGPSAPAAEGAKQAAQSEVAQERTGAKKKRAGAAPPNTKTVCGHVFRNYGSHCENFPVPYCTVAVAIGAKRAELEAFLPRLRRVALEMKKSASGQ
ncbi:O-phosphoseryl-tRNA(Sec) selenium transferase [Besnoitia besnoiti]|uniref:O-phosphoseryl-tRNA(Sec) selenium transferase n=1 Tax=Besnoitia besnoiti TaxID=94643 RepID=A0A2A9MKJ0_BESBE|nr:O-phosphoseryl-tRNA(Sec) selenium transferase [Besnoitia besnoiti]PFH35932.1 O-phosphoseryl-tRNA(Sec) selenium transferase [Besnoitia besnoiti]